MWSAFASATPVCFPDRMGRCIAEVPSQFEHGLQVRKAAMQRARLDVDATTLALGPLEKEVGTGTRSTAASVSLRGKVDMVEFQRAQVQTAEELERAKRSACNLKGL